MGIGNDSTIITIIFMAFAIAYVYYDKRASFIYRAIAIAVIIILYQPIRSFIIQLLKIVY